MRTSTIIVIVSVALLLCFYHVASSKTCNQCIIYVHKPLQHHRCIRDCQRDSVVETDSTYSNHGVDMCSKIKVPEIRERCYQIESGKRWTQYDANRE
jgi:hypothetical protein